MAEHIVAIFDTDPAADAAARDLETAGIPASSVRRYRPREGLSSGTPVISTETPSTGGGFWAWLLGEESTGNAPSYYPRDEERYVQGARAGNAVVSVMVEDASRIHEVVTMLEAHHPLELEEETDESAVRDSAAELSSLSAPAPSAQFSSPSAAPPASPHLGTGPDVSAPSRDEEVIPLAEEQIEVGKRTVDRGVTRVRRYVVERPVEQDVTLRGQRVTIERRRPLETTGAPGQAFEERVVEVHETEEVPVVAKTAHVVEEVAIRKEATERTETVRDTVRREEVDVTDQHGRPVSRP
jgi:uncharacterized protein (TIGR02271 family)